MPRRQTDGQRGQAIVVMAAIIVILVIFGALVFDLGLAMSDRRNLQAYADAAALAGARSYTPASVAGAHWVAMQYLTGPLGFTLPTGSCTNSANCPAGTYTVSPFTIQLSDSTLPGWTYPTALDVVDHPPAAEHLLAHHGLQPGDCRRRGARRAARTQEDRCGLRAGRGQRRRRHQRGWVGHPDGHRTGLRVRQLRRQQRAPLDGRSWPADEL